MRVFSRATAVSMIDLMCCSFGAAFLLLLIASSATPERKGVPRNSSVIIRCYSKSGPKAEIQMEFRRPGEVTWKKAEELYPHGFSFSASAEPTSGAESIIVIFEPSEGLWMVRARVVGFPQNGLPWEPLTLTFETSGDQLTPSISENPDQVVIWPGDRTPAIPVRVVAD